MLPVYKGTVALKLGNQIRSEAYWPLTKFIDPIEEEYPGGVWKPCIVHRQPGFAYVLPRPQDDGLWVMRLEKDRQTGMSVRRMSVLPKDIFFIDMG